MRLKRQYDMGLQLKNEKLSDSEVCLVSRVTGQVDSLGFSDVRR
jgi:hypothetical protein